MKTLTRSAILAMVITFGVSLASATVVVETFDYSAGTLGTANGGNNWQSTWGNSFSTAGGGTVLGSSTATVAADSLTNGAYTFIPNGNKLIPVSAVSVRKFSTNLRIPGNSNDTLYFSFLIQPIYSAGERVFKLAESSINGGYNLVEVGYGGGQWRMDGGAYCSGGGGSGVNITAGTGDSAYESNAVFFAVGKVVTSSSANDACYVKFYKNGPVAATDTLSTDNTLNWSVNRTDGRATTICLVNMNGVSGYLDEIRIGDTYNEVALPEPALLGVLALAGLLLRRA